MRWTEQQLAEHIAGKSKPILSAPTKPFARCPKPVTEDGMNKTEARYAREVLGIRKMAGFVIDWRFEAIKLRLAKRTWYTPDFMVWTPEGIEIHETKGGFIRDDAAVKIKVAAETFKEFKFVLVQYIKRMWVYKIYD